MDTSNSICWRCINHREVVSGKGSVFLLCKVSKHGDGDLQLPNTDAQTQKELLAIKDRWPKYPPQPLRECPFFVRADIYQGD
ncbi:MAG: hypothetical protein NTW52_03600 [Planctomycetota bacterium]|nr:hypothetical protein [Planctomycetota bacterium]